MCLPSHSTKHQRPENPSVEEKDEQHTQYVTGASSAWGLAGSLDTRVKRQEGNTRNCPELYFLFLTVSEILETLRNGRAENLAWSLLHHFALFHIFSYFLQ